MATPARSRGETRIAATCFVLALLAAGAGRAQTGPGAPPGDGDLVVRLERRLAKRLADVDRRAGEAEAACRDLRGRSRFLDEANSGRLPAGPSSERVEALQQEVYLLSRLEVQLRRRFASALDRHLLLQSVLGELDEAVARRRRLPRPRRGPQAVRDRLLDRMLDLAGRLRKKTEAASTTLEREESALDEFLARKGEAEEALTRAEAAWAEERSRAEVARQREKSKLAGERRALHERWMSLVQDAEALRTARAGPVARLRNALVPAAKPPGGAGEKLPLTDVLENARARAALNTAVAAREELARIAVRERDHLEKVARFHRDWGLYLERCRQQGIDLPALPGLDAEQSLEAGADARLAAREKAEEPARLARENARTRELLELLVVEGKALRRKYLTHPDLGGLFPPPRGDRRLRTPAVPVPAPPAMAEARAAVLAAETARRDVRSDLGAGRLEGMRKIERVLEATEALGGLRLDDPLAAAEEKAIADARRALVECRDRYLAALERDRTAALTLEERHAVLARLVAAHRTGTPASWRKRFEGEWLPRLRRQADRLPSTEALIAIAAGLAALGLAAGRLRRLPLLSVPIRLLGAAGLLVLVGAGLLRSGPAAHALAGVGALGVVALTWTVPLDLLAGLRLRLSGRGRPGELVWNDAVRGRVLKRGLLGSVLDVGAPERPRSVWIGNRRLVRSRPPGPAGAAAPASPPVEAAGSPEAEAPAAGELVFHVSLDSDWIAVRQLVQQIGRRHDPRADVQFRMEGRRIRLLLELAPAVDLTRVREEVRRALRAAPFARPEEE